MKAHLQRRLRTYHHWLGLLFAPAIMFFAITGSLQILGLHENGPGYAAPYWIKPLASIHKHGLVPAQPEPIAAAAGRSPAGPQKPKERRVGMAQLFIALMGAILALSSILGVWIALTSKGSRRTMALLVLTGGMLLPILLLAL